MNQVLLVGRLGGDPDHKSFNGKNVYNMNVATSENVFTGGEWKQKTEWHRVVMWSEQERTFGKGDLVEVVGKMKTRSYEKDGKTFYITEVEGHVKRLSKSEERQAEHQSEGHGRQPANEAYEPATEEGLPF